MKFKIFILIIFLISLLSLTGLCKEEKIELIELNADNFQEEVLESNVPVVIDFWAVWCKPCKKMSSIIERLAVFWGKKVKFVKVNVDTNRKFLNRFRPLRGLPVLIFYKNGKEIDRILGLVPFITINSKIILMLKGDKEEKEKKEKKENNCDGGICQPPKKVI